MSYTPVTWTQAGLDAAINADGQNLKLEITHISAGSESYEPSVLQTALRDEKQRVPIADGDKLSRTQIQLAAIFDGDLQYEVNEIGFWQNDLLVAVFSVPGERLNYKSATAQWVELFTLDISALPADTVTFVVGVSNINLFLTKELALISRALVGEMHRSTKLNEKVNQLEKLIKQLTRKV